jgi:PAS domain S-box-containing protein
MVLLNRNSHIAAVNTRTEMMFGYRREELAGQPATWTDVDESTDG